VNLNYKAEQSGGVPHPPATEAYLKWVEQVGRDTTPFFYTVRNRISTKVSIEKGIELINAGLIELTPRLEVYLVFRYRNLVFKNGLFRHDATLVIEGPRLIPYNSCKQYKKIMLQERQRIKAINKQERIKRQLEAKPTKAIPKKKPKSTSMTQDQFKNFSKLFNNA
jgi:hypothetical protein